MKNGVVFYQCTLGKDEKEGATLCNNKLSLKSFEKMLDYISDMKISLMSSEWDEYDDTYIDIKFERSLI